jgi:hypothetical protein
LRQKISGNRKLVPPISQTPSVKEELRLLREVYAEDRAMLEGLQKGLRTHYYNQAPLAGDNVEGTIWDTLQYT